MPRERATEMSMASLRSAAGTGCVCSRLNLSMAEEPHVWHTFALLRAEQDCPALAERAQNNRGTDSRQCSNPGWRR